MRASATATIDGPGEVARRAANFAVPNANLRWVLVNGSTGVIVENDHGPVSIMAFTIKQSRICEIYSLLDPERISKQIANTAILLN